MTLTEDGAASPWGSSGAIWPSGFLTGVLGIPDDQAEATACKMEHVLEPEVLAYFVAYAEAGASTALPVVTLPRGRPTT